MTKKQKILMVTFEYGAEVFGGIGACLNGLVPELNKLVEVAVCKLIWDHKSNKFTCKYNDNFRGAMSIDQSASYIEDIMLYIFKNSVSHVHAHHASYEIVELFKEIRIKDPNVICVYSVHSIFAFEKRVRKIPASWIEIESELLSIAEVIHVLNKANLDSLELHYNNKVKNKAKYVIPNGFDRKLLQKKHNQADGHKIICVSRWAPGKGIEFFLAARKAILEKWPETEFILCGRQKSPWGQHVEIYQNDIDKILTEDSANTLVYDWLPLESCLSLISEAKLVVNPSELEYCPYSFIEPAVIGTPIIASGLTSNDLYSNFRNLYGNFFVGDADDLARAVDSTLTGYDEAVYRSQKLRQLMIERYSWSSLVESYLKLYQ